VGRLCRCSLYYSRLPRSDLQELRSGRIRKKFANRYTIQRTSWADRTSYGFEGRAPEKGAATEARPGRGYASARDCERGTRKTRGR